jgi:hypothetical protein
VKLDPTGAGMLAVEEGRAPETGEGGTGTCDLIVPLPDGDLSDQAILSVASAVSAMGAVVTLDSL